MKRRLDTEDILTYAFIAFLGILFIIITFYGKSDVNDMRKEYQIELVDKLYLLDKITYDDYTYLYDRIIIEGPLHEADLHEIIDDITKIGNEY